MKLIFAYTIVIQLSWGFTPVTMAFVVMQNLEHVQYLNSM